MVVRRILIMKVLTLVITLSVCVTAEFNSQNIFSTEVRWCLVHNNVVDDYRHALYQFTIDIYRHVSSKALNHFVISPLSIWIILASIAEATDPITKRDLFEFLRLPINPCHRLKYYQLATSRFAYSSDVSISNIRALIIDEGVKMNPAYYNFINNYALLYVMSAPMRCNSQKTVEEIRRLGNAKLPNIDLRGNSVILDTVDYNGLWTTAFENAVIERSPFYSEIGEHIGAVDLMKIRRRVRRAYVRSLNIRAIEIPVGYNDRYRLVIGTIIDDDIEKAVRAFRGTVFDEYLSSIQDSIIPIDIAIPRLNITFEHDIKAILEEFGVKNLWTVPTVTRYLY